MAEPLGSIILSEGSKEIAKPILRKLLDNGSKIISALKSDFLIQGQEVTFLCPDNMQKWGVVFLNKKGLLSGKKTFPSSLIKKVSVESITPYKNVTSECVSFPPEGGFELSYKHLNPNVPYLLNVESEIAEPRFMENIVYRKVQDDTPALGKKKYWMQAQLKFLDVFEKMFSDVRLENLDFDVKVSTHEDINTSVPGAFRRELDVVVEWMKETNPERKSFLNREHLRLLRARRGGKLKHKQTILSLIQDLQDVFLPMTFRTFLSVQKDFYYHDSIRGIDYYTAPFPTWPKFMMVVTRTDLNLRKPAANGFLEFNQQGFKSKISDIFMKFGVK